MANAEQSVQPDWIITFVLLLGLSSEKAARCLKFPFKMCFVIYVIISMPENQSCLNLEYFPRSWEYSYEEPHGLF